MFNIKTVTVIGANGTFALVGAPLLQRLCTVNCLFNTAILDNFAGFPPVPLRIAGMQKLREAAVNFTL